VLLIGCDYHPSMQQIAWADTETGECGERRLAHCAEAEQFYRDLKQKGVRVRVGMEATGHSRWFERLLTELNFELWVGDPAQIRAKQVRKQKNDRRDAAHLLKLMLENHFPRLLGAYCRGPRCTSTGMASASAGADANQGDEPASGHRYERRCTTQAWAVEPARASAAGIVAAASLDQPSPTRTARTAGSVQP